MAGDQMRRQHAFAHQRLRAIDVAQDQVGQHGALDHRRLDLPSSQLADRMKGTMSSCQGRAWPPRSS